jgi:transcriptional regulator with XRE-family HTH domain
MKVVSETHRRFGQRLKSLRKENDMTQEDLADKVGVDRSYMGFVERGEKNVTLKRLVDIAKAFRVSLSELFHSV